MLFVVVIGHVRTKSLSWYSVLIAIGLLYRIFVMCLRIIQKNNDCFRVVVSRYFVF